MNKIEAIVFDLDGTLYSFDDRNESHFPSSRFGQQIQANCRKFFQDRFGLNELEAQACYLDFNERYQGEVSLGLERERGVPRSEYFAVTWNLQPQDFLVANQELKQTLSLLSVKTGILSAAPRIWVDRVLQFLAINQFFAEAIFTGDPDIRKPDPRSFQQLVDFWQLAPQKIVSIGDQEKTDILPAKSLGMLTVRIGRDLETKADFQAGDVIQAIALLKEKGLI